MRNLAIFDLDHTLINTDSDNAWPQFMIEKGYLDAEWAAQKNAQFYQDYQNACLDVHEFVAFQVEPLKQFDAATLQSLHAEFMDKKIKPYITDMAKMLIESHRAAGDELLVISSTNEFIITPICHFLGIHEVIGTRLERDEQGQFTGKILGVPSLREGKITRLHEWLQQRNETLQDYGKTYFYSDSKNDLPLLEMVDEAVAVNADEVLREHAKRNGWPILDLV